MKGRVLLLTVILRIQTTLGNALVGAVMRF